MMQLLVPLGLLGLLGILALIIIYIIRPNYQVKHLSSTYVWELSLKYKKKRIPTSRIRNILIFLCQLLILGLLATILAMPVIRHEGRNKEYDVIVVIDSSASMYAGEIGDSRFIQAVDKASEIANYVFSQKGGRLSVIVADGDPDFLSVDDPDAPVTESGETGKYLVRRSTAADRNKVEEALDTLIDDENACYYGEARVEEAMARCTEILLENPTAEIRLITDVTYERVPEGVQIEPVGNSEEWNAAILSASADIDENFYSMTVRAANYGTQPRRLKIDITVQGANSFDADDSGVNYTFSEEHFFEAGSEKTLIFSNSAGEETADTVYFSIDANKRFYSYKTISVSISSANAEPDDFAADDSFLLYGGQKQILRVQYASTLPNPFLTGAIDVLINEFAPRYNIDFTDVKVGDPYATEGYDFYIFEHQAPERLPSDGVIFLIDPPAGYSNSQIGLSVMNERPYNNEMPLSPLTAHPIMQNVHAEDITVTRIKNMYVSNNDFDTLMICDEYPVLLAQKNNDVQIAVLGFSVHYSTIAEKADFYILMRNIFDYYFPGFVDGNLFDVGGELKIDRARGPEVTVSGLQQEKFTQFPALLQFDLPGTYTVGTTSYFTSEVTYTDIYVKIPQTESNIFRTEYTFNAPRREKVEAYRDDDLLIYFAAALVLLLFAEWWLQGRENR